MIKSLLALLGLAVLAYVALFVPLGERTFYQHVRRIWATDEAQELSRDLESAAQDLEADLEARLYDAGVDAGR